MTTGNDHSIARIRTYTTDALRARGEEVPNRPVLKQEEKSVQQRTDAILATPKETKLPQAALDRKREKVKKSSEFLAASDATMPVPKEAAPIVSKAEEILSKEKLAAEVVASAPKPKKLVVDTTTLANEVAQIEGNFSDATTLNQAPQNISLHDDAVEGTIIQNKKRKKFRLLPAIGASLQNWFGTKKEILTKQKEPEHMVSKAETRIATIAAAARASYHVPQNDHGITVKRLTTKKREAPKTSVGIKKKEDVPAPTWTHTTDETPVDVRTLKMPEQENAPAAVPEEQVADPIDTLLQERVVAQGPPPKPVFDRAQEKEETKTPTPVAETPSTVQRNVTQPPAAKTAVSNTPPVSAVPKADPVATPVLQKKPIETKTPRLQPSAETQTATRPSRVPIYIYGLVIVGASLLGIGTSVYMFMGSTPAEQAAPIRIPSLLQTTQQIPVTLHTSKDATFQSILNASLTSRETIQIYPTMQDTSGKTIPADAQTILNSLALRTPGSFTRDISEIMFGSIDGTKPFILIQTTNFDTSFAGMLQWEPVLSSDLSPLFGSPVSESYDPYARTDTQIRTAFFRDTVIANKSARVLVDATNSERLIYSFIKQNMILITPDSETFVKLLPLIGQ